jgi:hypothetical protein
MPKKTKKTKKLKKFQVAVNGQYNSSTLCSVEPNLYYIRAENQNTADEQALKIFRRDYPDAINVHASKTKVRNSPAIICLAIACVISLIPWNVGGAVFSLAPSMVSTLVAVGLYSAVIIRLKGLQNSFNGVSEIILSLLTILFCSSFINYFCGDVNIQIFWFKIFISGKIILTFAILISWIGMASIAGIVWIALFVLAATRFLLGDAAMGIWGIVYVLSAFLGIILQLKQQSPDFLNSLSREMVSIYARSHSRIVRDMGYTASAIKEIAHPK